MQTIKLRSFVEGDIDALVAYLNCESVIEFLSMRIPCPYNVDHAKWWINEGSKTGIIRAIELDGQLIGCIGVEPGEFEYAKTAEIGYWLGKDYWHKGYASQALIEIIELVKKQPDIHQLQATVFEGNNGSERVLQKAGFELEGVFTDAVFKNERFYNTKIYAKVL